MRLSGVITFAVLLLCGLPGVCAVCPALPPLRTPSVASGFNTTRLVGFWYEWAFEDPAQVGATCQTLNATQQPGGVVDMAFAVHYGAVPFTIVEIYDPVTPGSGLVGGSQSSNTSGLYIKRVNAPGSKLAELPTVFVDATSSSFDGKYDTMTIFSCAVKVGITVKEIIFAGRTPTPPAGVLENMKQVAIARGLSVDKVTSVKPC